MIWGDVGSSCVYGPCQRAVQYNTSRDSETSSKLRSLVSVGTSFVLCLISMGVFGTFGLKRSIFKEMYTIKV